ncbi:MAG: ParB N-terminal domain-containing protein [Acidobacteria bacterium]|nr:ParB N-terminal domain-containing protein [Acidobacteriota bacterium]
MPPRKTPVRRKKVAPASVGLSPAETRGVPDAELDRLGNQVESEGGAVLGSYRDPVGGRGLLLVALPIDKVDPTPYQRDASDPHVKRLMTVIEKVGRFLDPIIVIRHVDRYWTPNGNHRLQALRRLGIKTVIGLLVPEAEVAFKILALNTEKAHNLREKSLETIRMARALAETSDRHETEYGFEFEQAPFLTLGICYEQRPRLSGGAYQSLLKRIDEFIDRPLAQALKERERRASRVLDVDERVATVVERLKARGLTSPYLKAFVVARINPIRFSKATSFDFDEVVDKMRAAAVKFNVERIRQEDVARMGGASPDEE